jgi:RNA polymerase sigma-70 factor (ECF subfamily)
VTAIDADDDGSRAAEPGDDVLLARHVAGDPDAFAEIVRRHQDRLWAVALRTLGDREEAADAVQDALISALRSASSFRGDSQVTTWLHRIVVNACLDRARRSRVRATVPMPAEDRLPAGRDDHERTERAAEVQAALAELPVEQAAALVLVDSLGFTVDLAAQILDAPTGTVKSRCARGRARLAVLLGHLEEQPAGNRTETAAVPVNTPATAPGPTEPAAPHEIWKEGGPQ